MNARADAGTESKPTDQTPDVAERMILSLAFARLDPLALGVAAVALIANTIHMAIYARREEIEIMRLVGASNWFVRVPFLLEGAIEGLVGAGLAVAFIVIAQQMALDRLTDLPEWINLAVENDFIMQRGALVLLFGVVAGLVGSGLSLAVHRYLRT